MAKRKDTDVVQLKLRLVERLRKKLEVAAKAEYRSINSEIVRRLEKSFGVDFDLSDLGPPVPGETSDTARRTLERALRPADTESKPRMAPPRKIGGRS